MNKNAFISCMDLERLPLHDNSVDPPELPELDSSADTVLHQPTKDMPSLVLQSEGSDSNSESGAEEQGKESEKGRGRGRPPLGKRKRNLPAKYSSESVPNIIKKKRVTRGIARKEKEKIEVDPAPRMLKRGSRCGKCAGCVREDCGKCIYCLDKPKFGGPAKKKQRCALRTCSNFEHRRKSGKKAFEGDGTAPAESEGGRKTLRDYAIKKEPVSHTTFTVDREASLKMRNDYSRDGCNVKNAYFGTCEMKWP